MSNYTNITGEEMSATVRARNVCFTSWVLPTFNKMEYMCYGIEICPKTGRTHYQGYAEFSEGCSRAQVKKRFKDKSMHIEIRRGTQEQAINYCKKDGDFHEFGEKSKQGERTDLKTVANSLFSGSKKLTEIMEEEPELYCRYRNGLKDIAGLATKKNTQKFRKVETHVIWGKAGSGKTRQAVEENPDYYILDQDKDVWFDGYDGEKTLILDDYYGWINYATLLRMLDGYQYRCKVKGSFTYANWDKVIITSNSPPEEWYGGMPEALKRRIQKVTHKCTLGNTDQGTNEDSDDEEFILRF